MAKNGKDTKQASHIYISVHFVINGGKCKMQKIDLCVGGMKWSEI